jgi:hypothetical protein
MTRYEYHLANNIDSNDEKGKENQEAMKGRNGDI